MVCAHYIKGFHINFLAFFPHIFDLFYFFIFADFGPLIEANQGENSSAALMIDLVLGFLRTGQCSSVIRCLGQSMRALVSKYSNVVFNRTTEYSHELCLAVSVDFLRVLSFGFFNERVLDSRDSIMGKFKTRSFDFFPPRFKFSTNTRTISDSSRLQFKAPCASRQRQCVAICFAAAESDAFIA